MLFANILVIDTIQIYSTKVQVAKMGIYCIVGVLHNFIRINKSCRVDKFVNLELM